jgi:membrane fusion protein, multidrug efflux system
MAPTPFLRRHRSALLILAVGLLLAAWIVSGVLTRAPPALEIRSEAPLATVAVRNSHAERVERLVTLQGEVLPDQQVIVRAETEGRVVEVPVALGETVSAGAVLARIGMDDRAARLRRAEAAVKGAETDFRGAEQLAREGFQAQLRVDTALAELEAARADLESIQLDIERTRVRAPISGVVDRRHAEVGDYVTVGAPVSEIIENNPLKAIVHVPQHRIDRVRQGRDARVTFSGTGTRVGVIRHVSARADTATRTFRVEIEVPNPDRSLPSGISVQVRIPVEEVLAHRISPALVALDAEGRLGIKTLDEEDRVEFRPVDPMRADSDGIWVSGLPEAVRIITIGQGFVSVGERVRVISEELGPAS